MISATRLRDAIPGIGSGDVSAARAQVIAQWEALAFGKWAWAENHVEVVEPFDDYAKTLHLELRPVDTIITVKERSIQAIDDWADITALDASVYAPRADGRLIRRQGDWLDEVEVTYTGGYPDDEAPADILEALILQARYNQERHQGEKLVTSQTAAKDATVSFLRADYHPLFMATAKRHRRVT